MAATLLLRNPPSYLGASTQQHSARNDRLTLGTVYRPAGDATTPLAVAGGAVIGPTGTMGEVTLLSNTQIRVNPARWVVPGGIDTKQGQYVATHDQQDTMAVTAQDATLARRSYLAVVVDDSETSGVASTATTDRSSVQVIDGPLAATNPALPALTAYPNILLLGEFLIPSTTSGQSVTWTPYSPRTGLRGAILPIVADGSTLSGHDGAPGVHDGQYRDHPTLGLQRWIPTRTAWEASGPSPDILTPIYNTGFADYVGSFQALRVFRTGRQARAGGLAAPPAGNNGSLTAGTTYTVATIPAGALPTANESAVGPLWTGNAWNLAIIQALTTGALTAIPLVTTVAGWNISFAGLQWRVV